MTSDFDMAQQLKSEEDIAAYITMVIEDGDAAELAQALGVAAKARGMSEVAKSTGIISISEIHAKLILASGHLLLMGR